MGARCDECPLKGSTPVFPEPPKSAKARLIVVGEGPGRKEEIQGRPFIGPSGALLDTVLQEAGLRREDIWVTNATLCRPETDKEGDKAAECCAPRLLREVCAVDAPVLTLGKSATKSVLGVGSIQLARGFVWTAPALEDSIKSAEAGLRRAARKADSGGVAKFTARVEELKLRHSFAGRVVFPTVHPAFVLRSDAWRPILANDVGRTARWVKGEL